MRLIVSLLFSLPMILSGSSIAAQPTCELTPLTLPLFDGTPVAELATPSASPAADTLEIEEATEILEMYAACTNTGDPTLVWAMFTPRWFSVTFADSEQHYLPAFEYQLATGEQLVENPLVLVSVDEVELRGDGRTAVTATFASGDLQWTDQLILAKVDGQWLIDEVVLVSPSG